MGSWWGKLLLADSASTNVTASGAWLPSRAEGNLPQGPLVALATYSWFMVQMYYLSADATVGSTCSERMKAIRLRTSFSVSGGRSRISLAPAAGAFR